MNAEKFTQKSLEAIKMAQNIVIEYQNMQIDQQHLMVALLKQPEGLVPKLLKKMHVSPEELLQACEQEIARIPKVSGPGRDMERVYVSQAVDAVLTEAEQQAAYMKD